jgi:ribosomal protein L37AE/L43A
MAAVPTQQDADAAQDEADATYRCPECDGHLSNDKGYWTCLDCTYVPYHPAD